MSWHATCMSCKEPGMHAIVIKFQLNAKACAMLHFAINKTCVLPSFISQLIFTFDYLTCLDVDIDWNGLSVVVELLVKGAFQMQLVRRHHELFWHLDLQKFSPQINEHVSISSFVQYFHLHAWLVSRFAGCVHHLHGAQIINIRLDSNILVIHLLNEKAIYQFAFSTSAKLFVVYHPW